MTRRRTSITAVCGLLAGAAAHAQQPATPELEEVVVTVNAANAQFFEPSPTRNFLVGVTAAYPF